MTASKFSALLLLMLSSGCTTFYHEPDETILGIEFDWGSQTDRDATAILIDCVRIAGEARHFRGAKAHFTNHVTRDCGFRPDRPVAGCWKSDATFSDLILLAPAHQIEGAGDPPRLSKTALCHELLHRARCLAKGQGPGTEDPWHCDRALWEQIGVPVTGPCPPTTPSATSTPNQS